jgi:hypothetical protein
MDNDEALEDRESMRKRDKELVAHRLSFLPEIKQEIQHYLALSQTERQSSNLQKSLSRLEEIPDLQETLAENDFKKLFPFFSKLERAKSVALTEILSIQTTHELRLNSWHIGVHVVRDSSGLELSRFQVDHVWAVNILPSFEVPARVAVLYQPTYYRVIFGVGRSPDNVSTSVIQTELPKSWIDPLEQVLCQLDLFHGAESLSLDGIEYDFYNLSWASESRLHFSNPIDSQFIQLEKAFFSVAEKVVNEKGQRHEQDYLAIWKKYLARQDNA